MEDIRDKTIYKLYKDTLVKPTGNICMKPLAGLASSSLTLAIANSASLDNNIAESVSIGMITYFGLACIKNIKQYIKEKIVYDSNYSRLNNFKEEIRNVVGTNYNLDIKNVVVMPNMDFSTSEEINCMKDVVFKDNSRLSEVIDHGEYSCLFYKDKDLYKDRKDAVDITEIAKKILERK